MPWALILLALSSIEPPPPSMAPAVPGAAVSPLAPTPKPVQIGGNGSPLTFLPVPLVTYDSDNGLGLGLAMALFYNDGTAPYRLAVIGQVLETTDGVIQDYVKLDYLGVLGTRFRLNTEIRYLHEPNASFYGIGNTTPSLAGATSTYYSYGRTNPAARFELRHVLTGDWFAYAGYLLEDTEIQLYQGSLLSQTKAVGIGGGLNSPFQLGVVYDSRDFEPWPTRGQYTDIALRAAGPETGSNYSWVGGTIVWRTYTGLPGRLVLANRFLLDIMSGNVPFFGEDQTGGLEEMHGLGGWSTLRGFVKDRFVGDGKLLENVELRRFFLGFEPFHQRLDIGVASFCDLGRIYGESFQDGPALFVHWDVGAGLRLMLNRNLVLRADVGASVEGARIYVLFGNIF